MTSSICIKCSRSDIQGRLNECAHDSGGLIGSCTSSRENCECGLCFIIEEASVGDNLRDAAYITDTSEELSGTPPGPQVDELSGSAELQGFPNRIDWLTKNAEIAVVTAG